MLGKLFCLLDLKLILGFYLLFFSIYFFILPQGFIIGGLESNLIFLDKIFFYKNSKQNFFFSSHNFIIFARVLLLLLCSQLHDFTFFTKTLIITILFIMNFQIFDYLKMKKIFFVDKILDFFKKDEIFILFLSILYIILFTGIGCGLIFASSACTGGLDCIFLKINYHFGSSIVKILILTDGLMILISFIIDFYRNKKNKRNIFIKYVFSFFCFICTVCIIDDIYRKYSLMLDN